MTSWEVYPKQKILCTQCLLLYCIHFLVVSTVQSVKPLRSSWRARTGYKGVERFRLCSTNYQKSDSQWSWSLRAHWCWVIAVQHIHKTLLDILGNDWRLVLVCIVLQEMDKMLDLREKYQYFRILMDLPITSETWIASVPFTVFCKAGTCDPQLFRWRNRSTEI